MKKLIICILLLAFVVAGCTAEDSHMELSSPPDITAAETAASQPTPQATTTGPETTPAPREETTPPVTTPAETQPPITTPEATRPAVTPPPATTPRPTQPAEAKPQPTTPAATQPPATTPVPTEPPVTTSAPTEPPVTTPTPMEPEETTPPAEEIDTTAIEAYGRSYARNTYGYNGTSSCKPSNGAGYFPGVRLRITTTEEGYAAVREAVDYQYACDISMGREITAEIDGVLVRRPINVYLEPTSTPNVYIVWCYYGGTI